MTKELMNPVIMKITIKMLKSKVDKKNEDQDSRYFLEKARETKADREVLTILLKNPKF